MLVACARPLWFYCLGVGLGHQCVPFAGCRNKVKKQEERRKMARLARYVGRHDLSWCGIQVEMTLLTLLICFPLYVLPQCYTPAAQELEFVVQHTCMSSEQMKPKLESRNARAHVGCNMRMLCRYRVSDRGEDYCADRSTTNLTVYKCEGSRSKDRLVVLNKTKCELTVEFTNMTMDMRGRYVCTDSEANLSQQRNIEVGEAPVAPTNITVVYSPKKDIVLRLNPMKTGRDLGDKGTLWRVTYKWKESLGFQDCHRKPRKCRPQEHGICEPCVIRLNHYNGCGQYTGFGILSSDIIFHINVTNMFGEASVEKTFILTNWVKPKAIGELLRRKRNKSSLTVKVNSILDIDQAHCSLMKKYPLKLQWTVDLVSAREQTLLFREGQEFFNKTGFVRNLEEDEAALSHTIVASFPKTSEQVPWNSKQGMCQQYIKGQNWRFTDLPFAGYHYNVSVQSFARYPGDTGFMNVSLTVTEETAPQVGPELHDSFAYCDTTKTLVSCVLYFKEIPRSKRGSAIVSYTVTVTLRNNCSVPHSGQKCSETTSPFSEEVGSQANSVLVRNLQVWQEYNVSLQAKNAKGSSPVSTKILRVYGAQSPKIAPYNIVLETLESGVYHLSWANPETDNRSQIQYYVHHCNATALHLEKRTDDGSDRSMKAAKEPLNCVTNMVSIPFGDSNEFRFRQPSVKGGLEAAFFVSAVTGDGISSGLQKVDCFYKKDTFPKEVDNFRVENATRALRVVFSLPCGKDIRYPHGRPQHYAIGIIKAKGSQLKDCIKLMQQSEFYSRPLFLKDNLQEVVYKKGGLEPNTLYLVGVSVQEGWWRCTIARPTDDVESLVELVTFAVIMVTILSLVVAVCVARHCWRGTKKKRAMFGLKKEDLRVPFFQDVPTKEVKRSLEEVESGIGESTSSSAIPIPSHSASQEDLPVIRDGTNRYPAFGTRGTQRYPCIRTDLEQDNSSAEEGDSDEEETEDSRSGREEDDDDDDDSEGSDASVEDSSSSVEQPLLSSGSRQPESLQEARLNSLQPSQAESRASLSTKYSRQSERKPSSYNDEERDEENTFSLDPLPLSDTRVSTPPTTHALSSDLTRPHSSSSLLGSKNQLLCQPDTLENHNSNPVCHTPQDFSLDKCQTLETGNSDGQGACQIVPQDSNPVDQFSIDDILQDAENSLNCSTDGAGAKQGACRTSDPFVMEDVLRAAAMCPRRNSPNRSADFQVNAAAGLQDFKASSRDSACFSSSVAGTESVGDTDAESETGTVNS